MLLTIHVAVRADHDVARAVEVVLGRHKRIDELHTPFLHVDGHVVDRNGGRETLNSCLPLGSEDFTGDCPTVLRDKDLPPPAGIGLQLWLQGELSRDGRS